jgi:lipoyl(octanoyl) transferase
MSRDVVFRDLGLIDFKEAWDYQNSLFREIVDIKLANREREKQEETGNYLLFCEHPPVFTLGKSGKDANLLIKEEELEKRKISFYRINRGGDITYHGPGQLVVYPILNLDYFFTDIHRYMRTLEEAVILTLADFGVNGERLAGSTGVWLEAAHPAKARKICAMGVHTSRWVTMHGIAFNINPDLRYFDLIIPCGITGKAVTSLEKETGNPVSMEDVKGKVKKRFAEVFDCKYITQVATVKV